MTDEITTIMADGLQFGGNFDFPEDYRPAAEAIRRWLADAGYAIVPVEPTEAMKIAGLQEMPWGEASLTKASNLFRAMIAASRGDDG